MEVNDKPIPRHLVDGLIVPDGVIVFGDNARVGSQRNFCMIEIWYIRVFMSLSCGFLYLSIESADQACL
jgi:hypothetical protein